MTWRACPLREMPSVVRLPGGISIEPVAHGAEASMPLLDSRRPAPGTARYPGDRGRGRTGRPRRPIHHRPAAVRHGACEPARAATAVLLAGQSVVLQLPAGAVGPDRADLVGRGLVAVRLRAPGTIMKVLLFGHGLAPDSPPWRTIGHEGLPRGRVLSCRGIRVSHDADV